MYLSDNKDDFLNFPKILYEGDPFYTTKSEDISQCEKLFVVKEDDKILARAGLIYANDCAQVSFFEAINDINSVRFLFDEIKKYAKSKGYEYLIGPINGSTWKKYRVTLPSENPPFLLDNYNKPYYAELFEKCGFETIANYTSSICKNLNRDYSRLEKFERIFEQKGVKIRKFDSDNFERDIRKIYEVSIKSFVNNFLYTPIEFEEFYKMYEPVKTFLNPEWILIAENENNEAIAFIFGFDNLYNRSEKSLILKTLAQIPDYKYKGIGSYLTEFLHKKAYLAGYDNIIHALMHENNVSANILSGELYHKYKLYGVKL
ncbi:hypothetical protein J6P92_06270 [bacterium]|nr:hypothetical protein [bacterium]